MTFQERAVEAIRASGGRITSQRELLLDLVATAHEDIDAESLYTQAAASDPNISLPTVYRILHTLESARLISSYHKSSDHERKVYRVVTATGAFHFTCRDCGRVIPFTSERVEQLKHEISTQLDADVAALCLCVGGLCADCRDKE